MKNCKYFEEQIMLKFYNEDYDRVNTNKHLAYCNNCVEFEKNLEQSLDIEFNEFKFEQVRKSVLDKPVKLNKFNWFKNLIAAACVLLFVGLGISFYNNVKNDENILIQANNGVKLIQKLEQGGEDLYKFKIFDNLDEEISSIGQDLNNLLEEESNEKI